MTIAPPVVLANVTNLVGMDERDVVVIVDDDDEPAPSPRSRDLNSPRLKSTTVAVGVDSRSIAENDVETTSHAEEAGDSAIAIAERAKAEAKAAKAEAKAARERERERVKAEKDAKAREKAEARADRDAAERAKREKVEKQAKSFVSFFKTPVKKNGGFQVATTPEASPAVTAKLDEILRAGGEAEDIAYVREDLLERWRRSKGARKTINLWGARRVEREIEVISILTSPTGKRSRVDVEKSKGPLRRRLFMIDCNETARPAFWGTGAFPNRPRFSAVVTGRAPFKMESAVDYEYDSAEDWIEEEPGENLSDADDIEDEDMSHISEDDDGFINDDEIISARDDSSFDAATIGDDEEMLRMRRTLATLITRSKRAQIPLIITSLAPSTPSGNEQRMEADGESNETDVSLLRAFAIETIPDAPRVSLEVSTDVPTSSTRAQPKTATGTSVKKKAEEIVSANLRMLIVFLLKNPKLKINQATEKFIEEASTEVAGWTKSSVNSKIREIATRPPNQSRWIVSNGNLEAVGLSSEDVEALRPVETAKGASTAKRMRVSPPVAETTPMDATTAAPRTLEDCFKAAKTKELSIPVSLDDQSWVDALMSLQRVESEEDWPGEFRHMFDAESLCACVEKGIMPMFFMNALLKTLNVTAMKRRVRLACAQLIGPLLTALAERATSKFEQKLTAPQRATIENACVDPLLIVKFVESTIGSDDIPFKMNALGIFLALLESPLVPRAAQGTIRTVATSKEFLEFLTVSVAAKDLRYKAARVARSVFNGAVHVETCAVFRPTQLASLFESLLESSIAASEEATADAEKYIAQALLVLACIASDAPEVIDFAKTSIGIAHLCDVCLKHCDSSSTLFPSSNTTWVEISNSVVGLVDKSSKRIAKTVVSGRIATALERLPNERAKAIAIALTNIQSIEI